MGSERGRLHAWERKYNPGVTNASLVNIGTFIRGQTVTGAFPRSRPRVAKEPTPLPYLKPVTTSCQSAGRRQKTVTSVRYHQRPKLSVARRESEKQQLPAGPELAYLVVDLQSGTLSQTSENLCQASRDRVPTRRAETQLRSRELQSPAREIRPLQLRSRELQSPAREIRPLQLRSRELQSLAREIRPLQLRSRELQLPAREIRPLRSMSLTAISKPKPSPRRIPASPPDANVLSSPGLNTNEKEPTPPPVPIRKSSQLTPSPQHLEQTATPARLEDQLEGEGSSTLPHANGVVSSPNKPKPVPRDRHNTPPPSTPPENISDIKRSKPPVAVPPQEVNIHSELLTESSPTEVHKELSPPIPNKSLLCREIQRSVKKNPLVRKTPPLPPKVYGSREDLDQEIIATENDCYGTQISGSGSGYETPTLSDHSATDITTDAAEHLYITPMLPQQLPSFGKSKPARPPPPSTSAVLRAQQKRASPLASRHQTIGKSSSIHQHSRPKFTTNTGRTQTHISTTSTPLSTSVPTTSVLASATTISHPNYEELDIDSPFPPSYPPPLPVSRQGRQVSQASLTGPSPPLPPRAPNSDLKRNQRKAKHTVSVPIPSGFTRTSNIELHEMDELESVSAPSTLRKEPGKTEPEWDEGDDCVYEPIDTSIPLPPQRRKKKIRGTRTATLGRKDQRLTDTSQRTNSRETQPKRSLTDPVPRRSLPSSSQQVSKLALTTAAPYSPQMQLKTSISRSVSSDDRVLAAKVSGLTTQEDVGGVDDYVDMQYKIGWEQAEEEDVPENVYVDMKPGSGVEEEDEEDGPCMGPYASSDLLDGRPDLKS